MNHRKNSIPSRGAVLVVLLVCLMVAASFFVLVVKQVAMEHRALVSAEQRLQAVWLAEAGIERAAARLAADGSYTGEKWTITASDLDSPHDGLVTIEVKPVAGRPERRLVRAEAEYPRGPHDRNRFVKEITVDRDVIGPLSLWERGRGEGARDNSRQYVLGYGPHPSPLPKGEGMLTVRSQSTVQMPRAGQNEGETL